MKGKLDLKDKKILYELDKNARISLTQVGKKVGLSTEAIHYRIKRFEEKGIITNYHTSINFCKLGLTHFKICLKFNGIDLKTEEEYYKMIKPIPQVIWIARCQGDWDCMISCTVNNIYELDKVKDNIISIGNKYISEKAVSFLVESYTLPRNFFIKKQRTEYNEIRDYSPAKVDEIDLKILRILSKNSRMSVVEIAKEAKTTIKIVTTRINKLVREKVVNSFRLVVDYDKLGISLFKTFIYLKDPNKQRVKLLWNKLRANPNVIHNLKVIGEWDLEPEFEFENKEDFQKTIQNLMNEFSDIIQKISVIDILKEYKYTFFYK
jgi:DNA-binding Lrp family transcriptional regulator